MLLRVDVVSIRRLVIEGVYAGHRLAAIGAGDGVIKRIEGGLQRDQADRFDLLSRASEQKRISGDVVDYGIRIEGGKHDMPGIAVPLRHVEDNHGVRMEDRQLVGGPTWCEHQSFPFVVDLLLVPFPCSLHRAVIGSVSDPQAEVQQPEDGDADDYEKQYKFHIRSHLRQGALLWALPSVFPGLVIHARRRHDVHDGVAVRRHSVAGYKSVVGRFFIASEVIS